MRYIFLLFLTACATNLTEKELSMREDKRSVDAENWYTCEQVYKAHKIPTYHVGHSHGHLNKKRNHRPGDIRDDLRTNNCKRILRGHWVDYPTEDEY